MSDDARREELEQLARLVNDPTRADAFAVAREVGARAASDVDAAPVVVVSACLIGAPTRYDGGDRRTESVARAVAARAVLPLCPELLGGLGCPRPPARFTHGDAADVLAPRPGARLVDPSGADVSAAFVAGARRALALAQAAGAREAILKERSPSCGCHQVHSGDGLAPGRGVFAALAAEAGLRCRSDEELEPAHGRT